MTGEPKQESLKGRLKDRIDATVAGGIAQLRTEYQNASTVPQLKAVLAKLFKILLDL